VSKEYTKTNVRTWPFNPETWLIALGARVFYYRPSFGAHLFQLPEFLRNRVTGEKLDGRGVNSRSAYAYAYVHIKLCTLRPFNRIKKFTFLLKFNRAINTAR